MESFQEWFEKEKDTLERMLKSDPEEALYACYLKGLADGSEEIGKYLATLLNG